MPSDGSLTPADLVGKLETLVVRALSSRTKHWRFGFFPAAAPNNST
jgi:hypothetical protein